MMDINLLLQIFLPLRHFVFEYDLLCFTRIFKKIPLCIKVLNISFLSQNRNSIFKYSLPTSHQIYCYLYIKISVVFFFLLEAISDICYSVDWRALVLHLEVLISSLLVLIVFRIGSFKNLLFRETLPAIKILFHAFPSNTNPFYVSLVKFHCLPGSLYYG